MAFPRGRSLRKANATPLPLHCSAVDGGHAPVPPSTMLERLQMTSASNGCDRWEKQWPRSATTACAAADKRPFRESHFRCNARHVPRPTGRLLARRAIAINQCHHPRRRAPPFTRCAVVSCTFITLPADILSLMSRGRTRLAAWLALLAIFLAPLATAAYACPYMLAPLDAPPIEGGMSVGMDACTGMRTGQAGDRSALCVEHCKIGQQLTDTHPAVDHDVDLSLAAYLVATFVADPSARSRSTEPLLARATAPPIFASSSRLRI
jgi:hypothetical protein